MDIETELSGRMTLFTVKNGEGFTDGMLSEHFRQLACYVDHIPDHMIIGVIFESSEEVRDLLQRNEREWTEVEQHLLDDIEL